LAGAVWPALRGDAHVGFVVHYGPAQASPGAIVFENEIVTGGDADLVFIARELPASRTGRSKARQELGTEASRPISYGYAVKRRAK
jgi:hypothetical protein